MNKLRIVMLLAVAIFALYPPAELTRCILAYSIEPIMLAEARGVALLMVGAWPGEAITVTSFYVEIAMIWGFYFGMLWLLWVAMGLIGRMGRHEGRQETVDYYKAKQHG